MAKEITEPKKAAIEVAKKYEKSVLRSLPLTFRWADHQKTCLRYIMDFSVLLQAADCRIGDLVLDYAAGSGWVTEWLYRLGFRVVSLDISSDLLRVGRERLGCDTRIEKIFPAFFVAGDCERLPFPDNAFDGVICFNSLHHMPDYTVALREIHRVLKNGRKAAFSEPGTRHTVSPEAVREMELYGVLERDLDVREIAGLAENIGFSEMDLKPFIYTEHLDYDRRKWEAFLRKEPPVIDDYVGRLIDFLITVHTVFTLRKGGARELDSRIPEALSAHIKLQGVPERIQTGSLIAFRARVKNTGHSHWLARRTPYGGFVTFGMKVFNEQGAFVTDALGRTDLGKDVAPGLEIELEVGFRVELAPGNYRIECDMVDEGIAWFQEIGSKSVTVSLKILE
jgi:ubiquinone/menaquinone biosynthesis C-methylase UbiE